MNNISLVGRLTKDPEHYTAGNGTTSVTKFMIAVKDIYSKDQRADFIRIVTFNQLADNCYKCLSKGKLVSVEGRFRSDSYVDNANIKRYTIDVIASMVEFLTPKGKEYDSDIPEGIYPVDENDVEYSAAQAQGTAAEEKSSKKKK